MPLLPLKLPVRHFQVAAVVVWLVLALVQLRTLPSHETSHFFAQPIHLRSMAAPPEKRRLAVVNFVDSDQPNTLWGVYSIHSQLIKFKMIPAVEHVVLVASDMPLEYVALLEKWIGPDNVRATDKNYIRDMVSGDDGLWAHVFSKLEAFNLTEFDKLIVLDNDILIRRNIMHWFEYPAPAATQSRGSIEWNSGAMVIEPNEQLYKTMLDYLPKTRVFQKGKEYRDDPFNSGMGHQGFISAFFTSNATNDTITTMSYACSMLSSDLNNEKKNSYFFKYRPELIETVHLTKHKPWSKRAKASELVCTLIEEWNESVSGLGDDKETLPELPVFC